MIDSQCLSSIPPGQNRPGISHADAQHAGRHEQVIQADGKVSVTEDLFPEAAQCEEGYTGNDPQTYLELTLDECKKAQEKHEDHANDGYPKEDGPDIKDLIQCKKDKAQGNDGVTPPAGKITSGNQGGGGAYQANGPVNGSQGLEKLGNGDGLFKAKEAEGAENRCHHYRQDKRFP